MSEIVEKVVLYTGPMDAGKTTRLYDKMNELKAVGVPYVAFQPSFEMRGPGTIRPKTHSPSAAALSNCVQIASLLDITAEDLGGASVVAIDEFTLFGFDKRGRPVPGYYARAMCHLASLGVVAVYASGLNVAANGSVLPLLTQAIANGADVQMLTASCMVPVNGPHAPRCGKVARNSQIYSKKRGVAYDPTTLPALLPEGERPDLGYRPVCAVHFAIDKATALNFASDYPG